MQTPGYSIDSATGLSVPNISTGGAPFSVPGSTQGTEANADVDQVLETIATIDVSHAAKLGVEIALTGQNFDQFSIQARFHGSGSYQTLFDAAADFLSPSGVLIGASGDLTTIAAAASGWFLMDVGAIESIRLQAACAADNGATTCYWSAQ